MGHPAEKDAAHPVLIDERGESYDRALAAEYSGYVINGRDDRAEQVAEQILARGGDLPDVVIPAQQGEATGEPPVEADGDIVQAAPETTAEPAQSETAAPAKPAKRTRKR